MVMAMAMAMVNLLCAVDCQVFLKVQSAVGGFSFYKVRMILVLPKFVYKRYLNIAAESSKAFSFSLVSSKVSDDIASFLSKCINRIAIAKSDNIYKISLSILELFYS